jgi:hypothetical protein
MSEKRWPVNQHQSLYLFQWQQYPQKIILFSLIATNDIPRGCHDTKFVDIPLSSYYFAVLVWTFRDFLGCPKLMLIVVTKECSTLHDIGTFENDTSSSLQGCHAVFRATSLEHQQGIWVRFLTVQLRSNFPHCRAVGCIFDGIHNLNLWWIVQDIVSMPRHASSCLFV